MKLIRYAEAATLLGIAESTLRRHATQGTIPCLKPFGKKSLTYFDRDDLEQFLEASKRGPKAPAEE